MIPKDGWISSSKSLVITCAAIKNTWCHFSCKLAKNFRIWRWELTSISERWWGIPSGRILASCSQEHHQLITREKILRFWLQYFSSMNNLCKITEFWISIKLSLVNVTNFLYLIYYIFFTQFLVKLRAVCW